MLPLLNPNGEQFPCEYCLKNKTCKHPNTKLLKRLTEPKCQRFENERKKRKNNYTTALVDIMKTNEIDCVDINEGKILFTQSNVKKAINKQHLVECLSTYFEKNPNIPTDEIVKYILENRPINVKESIRHKPPKNV